MTSVRYALGGGWRAGKDGEIGPDSLCPRHVSFRIVIGKGAIDSVLSACQQIARSRQRVVNHVGGTKARYEPLTSEIKPIPMELWHAARNVRTHKKQVRQGANCEASNRARFDASQFAPCPTCFLCVRDRK